MKTAFGYPNPEEEPDTLVKVLCDVPLKDGRKWLKDSIISIKALHDKATAEAVTFILNNGYFELSKKKKNHPNKQQQYKPVLEDKTKGDTVNKSFIIKDNIIYEQIVRGNKSRFAFLDKEGKISYVDEVHLPEGEIKPIWPDEAVSKGAVLLPDEVSPYESIDSLIEEIRAHIKKYFDVNERFLTFSVYYILLSWVYDRFNSLPYLRFLGDTGVGKSRGTDVIGRLCYKPIVMSGAVTPAPIYRIIDKWNGTLLVHEGDLPRSDETNEVVTILNCGFERNRPVMRCDQVTFEPRFFNTYGPKVINTRRGFQDPALESRCITAVVQETDRIDIPRNLPPEFYEKEKQLRNKLLMFRLENYHKINPIISADFTGIEPRLQQIAEPLLAVLHAVGSELSGEFMVFIKNYNKDIIEERQSTFDGQIISALFKHLQQGERHITCKQLAQDINSEKPPSSQKIGKALKALGLSTELQRVDSRTGRYVSLKMDTLKKLARRYDQRLPEDLGLPPSAVTNVTLVTKTDNVTSVTSVTSMGGTLTKAISENDKGEGVETDEIAKLMGLPLDKIWPTLEKMRDEGDVFNPRPDFWKVL